eukprot:4149387-Pleurochrysis_carterae.AAC.1
MRNETSPVASHALIVRVSDTTLMAAGNTALLTIEGRYASTRLEPTSTEEIRLARRGMKYHAMRIRSMMRQ